MTFGKIKNLLASPALMSGFVLAVSLLALGAVLTAQYAFGLIPCTLCLYQRGPYVINALLGLVGLLLARRNQPRPAALMLCLASLFFLIGAAIAFYHAGVEQHWWVSILEGCKIDLNNGGDIISQIEAKPAVRCDAIAWQDPLLSLSMAAWNAVASFIFFVLSLAGSIFSVRRANGL
jgi:disulfide bond formation protein DsbB